MSALAEQHERWSGAKERLWNAPPPKRSTERRARPVSPFLIDVLERRKAAKEAREKAVEWLRQHPPHWSAIVKQVARKHRLRSSDLLGRSRTKEVVLARNEAYYRLRTELFVSGRPLSFPMIAKRFGKDHSSIVHGFYKHVASLEVVPTNINNPQSPLTSVSSEVCAGIRSTSDSLIERNSWALI